MSIKNKFKKNLQKLRENHLFEMGAAPGIGRAAPKPAMSSTAKPPEFPNLDGWSPKYKPQPVGLGNPNIPPVPMKDPVQHAYSYTSDEVNKIIKSPAPIHGQIDARTNSPIDINNRNLPPSHDKRSTQEVNRTITSYAPIKGQIHAGTGKEIPVVKENKNIKDFRVLQEKIMRKTNELY